MKTLSQNEINKLKLELSELTDINYHTEARLLLTKELMLVDLHREYNEIQISQELTDQLLPEYAERKYAADKFLFSIAKDFKECF